MDTYLPGIGMIISVLAEAGKPELTNASHSYTLPISLMFSDGVMNESVYIDEELM